MSSSIVVASAYDTSGNGGRKIVSLSNGWLISAVASIGTFVTYFYKSTDSGATWSQLCFQNADVNSFAICNIGNVVHYLIVATGDASNYYGNFDATVVTNVNQIIKANIDSSQTGGYAGCSITVDSAGTLHASWCSKNATRPNSFNIRYSNSTNGGVTWATITQVSTENNSSIQVTNPSITTNASNVPTITSKYAYNGPTLTIVVFTKNNTTHSWTNSCDAAWGNTNMGSGSASNLENGSCITKINGSNIGRIWSAWENIDSTDNVKKNIRLSWSGDNAATWSAEIKITSGNSVDRMKPVLAEGTNGDIYVFYQDGTAISYQKCADSTTTFSGTTTFAASGTNPAAQERAASGMLGVAYMDASEVKFDKLSFVPKVSVNIGGVWKSATGIFTNVGGTWKTVTGMPVNIGGTWKNS